MRPQQAIEFMNVLMAVTPEFIGDLVGTVLDAKSRALHPRIATVWTEGFLLRG